MPEFKAADGEAVFFRTVTLPGEWAGKEGGNDIAIRVLDVFRGGMTAASVDMNLRGLTDFSQGGIYSPD